MSLPHKCAGTTKNRPEHSSYKGWYVGALKVKPGCWEVGAVKKLKSKKGPTFLQATRSKSKAQGLAKIKKAIDAERKSPKGRGRAPGRTRNPMAQLMNPSGDKETTREPMARAPVSMDQAVGAEIGKVLELALPDVLVKFGRSKPPLLWFPEEKALGFFMYSDGDKTRGRPDWLNVRPSSKAFDELDEMTDVGPAVRSFKKFMGRGPNEARTYVFPYRSTRGWYSINRVNRIDYWSDKFRASREYTHEHGPGVRLYIYGSPRRFGPSFWLIRGGKLTVTEKGIIN